MTQAIVLLPSRARVGDIPWLATWRRRADLLAAVDGGRAPPWSAFFQWPGTALPTAALLRQHARGDAAQDTWVCADPAYVQMEVDGARLMACGTLDLDATEADQLSRTLRPLFGDHGMLIETTTPARWQLRLPQGARPPDFDPPADTLGDDLLPHLPQGDAGRRWRALFNEAQVILHNHPVNAARARRGALPVNALWFWGAGQLPAWVSRRCGAVFSDDPELVALCAMGGQPARPTREFDGSDVDVLLDLAAEPTLAPWRDRLETTWRRVGALTLLFPDGERHLLKRRHRWRFWRR